MSFSDIITYGVLPVMSMALLLALGRLLRGPSLPDRVVALDLLTTLSIGMIALIALSTQSATLLDVATVIALTAFLGTIAFAYYIERRRA